MTDDISPSTDAADPADRRRVERARRGARPSPERSWSPWRCWSAARSPPPRTTAAPTRHRAGTASAAGITGSGPTPTRWAEGGPGHAHERLAPYQERYDAASTDERAAADTLVADTRTTLAAYEDVDDAVAAGYRTRRDPPGLFAHYLDRSVAGDGHLLDPARPNGLVYYTGGDGEPVLLGAFFVAPPGVEVPATTGDLVVWHSHNPGCPRFFATEAEPCADVRRMVHVWTVGQVELTARRTGEPIAVEVTDPFGAPFRASVDRVG